MTNCADRPCKNSYEQYVCVMNSLQGVLLLALRLYFGYHFFRAGLGKLQNIDYVAGFFTNLGIPMPGLSAYLAGGTECIGGLLLLVGLGSRIVTLPLIFTMFVAYLTAHHEALANVFTDPETFMEQKAFLYLLTSIIVLFFGAGKYSLDALICKSSCNSSGDCSKSKCS